VLAWTSGRKIRLVRIGEDLMVTVEENTAFLIYQVTFLVLEI
jgi:hypothetical protein